MDQQIKNYEKISANSRRARVLSGVESMLRWDQETYMPSGSCSIRAEQLKLLAGMIHKERTSRSFGLSLAKLIDLTSGKVLVDGFSAPQKAALREWRRAWLKDRALPSRFVEENAFLVSESVHAWEKAKKENSFKSFLPFLEKIVKMSRKKAEYIGFEDHPYDALLDEYEPYLTKKKVEGIFGPLKRSIQKLLKEIQQKPQIKDQFLQERFEPEAQLAFNRKLLNLIGFPHEYGRLDCSAHPFSSSAHPLDNRITTRIDPNGLMSNIRSVLHECGHAFYEMGLPEEQYGTPLGEAVSLGIHESQSRFWEVLLGLSESFCQLLLPALKEHFKGKLEAVDLQKFWKAINKVEPSLIRVEADEVTYPLHVILRFELEVGLIEGSLKPKDLPDAWNEKMKELLGICPKSDAEGCLQDVHWSMGAFGYFPTYSLGNLYASHFFMAFKKEHPSWESHVARGDFAFIKNWLTAGIHSHGKCYTSLELLERVTGKPFTSQAYEEHLNQKYRRVYGS